MYSIPNKKSNTIYFFFKFSVFTATFLSLPLNWVNKFFLNCFSSFSYLKFFFVIFLVCFCIFNLNEKITKKTFWYFSNQFYDIYLKLASFLPIQSKYLLTVFVIYLLVIEPAFFRDTSPSSLKVSILVFSFFRVLFFMLVSYKYFFTSVYMKDFLKSVNGKTYFQQRRQFSAEAFSKMPSGSLTVAAGTIATLATVQARFQDRGSVITTENKEEAERRLLTAREQIERHATLIQNNKPPGAESLSNPVTDAISRTKIDGQMEQHTKKMRGIQEKHDAWVEQREEAKILRDALDSQKLTLAGCREFLREVGFPVKDEILDTLRQLRTKEDHLLDGAVEKSVVSSIIEGTFFF